MFPPPDQPAPLLDLFQQHASLQLTCKAWAAALERGQYQASRQWVCWRVHAAACRYICMQSQKLPPLLCPAGMSAAPELMAGPIGTVSVLGAHQITWYMVRHTTTSFPCPRQVSVETCLPSRGSHAWLQRHAAALYFEAPVSSEADYTSPLPQATFGVIHRRIRNEDAAGTCAANFRWLRRLNGAPKPHGYWVAGPQPPSAASADGILEWAMDMHDSCRLGHDSLMALLSQRVRSMHELSRQCDCTDPEMAQIVFPIAKLVPIRRMLPACRSLKVSGMCMQPMHPAGGQHAQHVQRGPVAGWIQTGCGAV